MIYTAIALLWMILGFRGIFKLWYRDFQPITMPDLVFGVMVSSALGAILGPLPLIYQKIVASKRINMRADDIGRFLAGERKKKKPKEDKMAALLARNAELERELEIQRDY